MIQSYVVDNIICRFFFHKSQPTNKLNTYLNGCNPIIVCLSYIHQSIYITPRACGLLILISLHSRVHSANVQTYPWMYNTTYLK